MLLLFLLYCIIYHYFEHLSWIVAFAVVNSFSKVQFKPKCDIIFIRKFISLLRSFLASVTFIYSIYFEVSDWLRFIKNALNVCITNFRKNTNINIAFEEKCPFKSKSKVKLILPWKFWYTSFILNLFTHSSTKRLVCHIVSQYDIVSEWVIRLPPKFTFRG